MKKETPSADGTEEVPFSPKGRIVLINTVSA